MYSAAFLFQPGNRDSEFDRLNRLIDAAATATDGYLGRELWTREDGAINATYYWNSLEALDAFSRHPDHLEAKRRYREWYRSYQVLVSKVLHSYGDGAFEHVVGTGLRSP